MFSAKVSSGRGGFTLIEVVAAMVIISVGLIWVLQTFTMGRKVRALREDRTAVVYLLQRLMEESKAKDFSAVLNESGDCSDISGCGALCVQLGNCTYAITEEDYNTDLHLKRIDVEISWEPLHWTPQTETISTVITER